MAHTLQGKRVAILAADGVERVELETPREAVQNAVGQTKLLSLMAGEIQARNNDLESAGTFPVDRAVADASVNNYDAGWPEKCWDTSKLRLGFAVLQFIHH
jgi:protease I